jgi:hypothetical protein
MGAHLNQTSCCTNAAVREIARRWLKRMCDELYTNSFVLLRRGKSAPSLDNLDRKSLPPRNVFLSGQNSQMLRPYAYRAGILPNPRRTAIEISVFLAVCEVNTFGCTTIGAIDCGFVEK